MKMTLNIREYIESPTHEKPPKNVHCLCWDYYGNFLGLGKYNGNYWRINETWNCDVSYFAPVGTLNIGDLLPEERRH